MTDIMIVTSDEDGGETEATISEHMRQWHGFNSPHEYADAHIDRLHDREHSGDAGMGFDYHAHPLTD